MAEQALKTPEAFPFHKPEEWIKWKRRFEQYRLASGLDEKSEPRQVNTLLYCMGDEAADVLQATGVSEADKKKYNRVVERFDDHFQVRKNLIYERARFNQRMQEKGESVELFITALHQAAETCEFGDLKEQMIRDRLVVGIRDRSLSERLQLETDLTLEKAKRLVRQREGVKEQGNSLTVKHEHSVDVIQRRKKDFRPKHPHVGKRPAQRQFSSTCRRCGKQSHPVQQCPARQVRCNKCNFKGHFAKMCLSKTVAEITEGVDKVQLKQEEEDADAFYLDILQMDAAEGESEPAWMVDIVINNYPVRAKVDTGAEVTVLKESTWNTIPGTAPLQATKKKLCGADGKPLDVKGRVELTMTYEKKTVKQPVFIIKNLKNNLLGLPALHALGIVNQVDAVGSPIFQQYPELFKGLGTFNGEYVITLKPDAKPHAIHAHRRVPLPLCDKVKQELGKMEKLGVISKVTEPTPWCAGMVVVPKPNDKVRICVDLTPLNESVLREIHPLPKVDSTLAQLSGAKIVSKLDTNSGFWQVPLAPESRLLTTFLTPWGRYAFNKLPFGISSAPEHFQKRMNDLLADIPGVICHIDDILVFGESVKVHDECLHRVLQRIHQEGLTLNKDKCLFHQRRVSFLGHIIDEHGIRPDPKKTKAIQQLPPPKNLKELRRIMGMLNHLNKFSPKTADLSKPLRELLSPKKEWVWTPAQEQAFEKIKEEISSPHVLAHYDLEKPTKISADASAYGLGAVLLQDNGSEWQPVAYASRSLTLAETRYAQIEKEALALTWACEKFSEYILGKNIELETDHKPLVPILGYKSLDALPPRVLRFRLRLMRFKYSIYHTPGKSLYVADTLSRAPAEGLPDEMDKETDLFVNAIVASLPTSTDGLERYRQAQANDLVCSKLMEFCHNGWPQQHAVKGELKKYWGLRNEITVVQNLLLLRQRIIIPESLRPNVLSKIHNGHQGIVRCRLRVANSVWWPGISKEVENFVQSCPECLKMKKPSKGPLIPTKLPEYPWEKVASDPFEHNGSTFLLVVDYYSRYIEVKKLCNTNSAAVVTVLKENFARHGVPHILVTDNGPQYASKEMKEFAEQYGFSHITSSPHYPQANGHAERAVKTVKQLLENSTDLYKVLLTYRATPLPQYGLSPAELLMGRRIRTNIPQVKEVFIPNWPHLKGFRENDEKQKEKQKKDFDRRHRCKDLSMLPGDTQVWVDTPSGQVAGRVVEQANTPRSYHVEVPSGQIRRNRRHLRVRRPESTTGVEEQQPQATRPNTRSQDGTAPGPPDYFK